MNICNEKSGIRIFSTHPSSEYHDISNLISSENKRDYGYLASSYVTPPVYILISLPNNIDINKISFKPSNGRHMNKEMTLKFVSKCCFNKEIDDHNYLSAIELFKNLKRDFLFDLKNNNENDVITINICRYNKRNDRTRHIYNIFCKDVQWILIGIISMKNRLYRPCLSCLMIYASLKWFIKEEFPRIKRRDEDNNEDGQSQLDPQLFPEQCTDPLTNEYLRHPIKLPCGKYINLSTLLKFWANKPADGPKYNPFTMVAMTEKEVKLSTTVDLEKRDEIESLFKSFERKNNEMYNKILFPSKIYKVDKNQFENESGSDEDELAKKLNENINKNFAFLLNKF